MSVASNNYPWYQIVEGADIQQGDIIENYEIISAFDENSEEIIRDSYRLIVMTQSCDIPKPKTTHIILCPLFTFDEIEKEWPQINDPRGKNKEKLRRGEVISFCLLNKCDQPGFEHPCQVVSFKRIFETPKKSMESFIKRQKRLRLLPPYREYLAQAFARFFMRVGLPLDIPHFDRS